MARGCHRPSEPKVTGSSPVGCTVRKSRQRLSLGFRISSSRSGSLAFIPPYSTEEWVQSTDMARTKNAVPRYCKHKASGQAVVRLGGVDRYLGPHCSLGSHERYE